MRIKLRELLEHRQILDSDIQQVIDFAETEQNQASQQADRPHFLAHYKPAAVTYWVEYTPADGEFVVHNAYSHRMEISEEHEAVSEKDAAPREIDWLCDKV